MGTTTTNLALYKPDEGEIGWADEVNANFDTLDERLHKPLGIQYVDARGDNANDGLTPGTAVKDVVTAYDNLDSDGGEIRVIGSATGGDIPYWDFTNQDRGLWLVGANDAASYANPPTGWRRSKALRLIGWGGREFYSDATGSPYPTTYIAGGSATDPLKPAIWIVGSGQSMYFENIRAVNLAQPVKIGLSAADGTTNINTAKIKFQGCYFRSNPVAATSEATVKTGYAFWIWFDHCVFDAPVQALTVSSVALSAGTTYTFTTSAAHGLVAGDVADVTGSSVSGYNGNWTIVSAPTTTTFTADIGTNPAAFSGTASCRTLLSNRRACILFEASSGEANPGLVMVTDCTFNLGGFRYRPLGSTSWGNVIMENITEEGDFTNDVPPVFHMPPPSDAIPLHDTAAGSGFIYLRHLQIADAASPYGAVNVEGLNHPGMVTVASCGEVIGPVQSAGGVSRSSLTNGDKVGMFQMEPRRLFGEHDGHRRAFHPTAARYANLAAYDETTWEAGTGTATVTTGQTAPDGSSRAGLLTASSTPDSTRVYGASRTVNVGDFFIFGGWYKTGSSGWTASSSYSPFRFSFTSGNLKVDIAQVPAQLGVAGAQLNKGRTDDGDWQFATFAHQVVEGTGGSVTVVYDLMVNVDAPMYFYAPVFIHVPVADGLTYAEVREIRDGLCSYSDTLAVGDVGTLPGQNFHVTGPLEIDGALNHDGTTAGFFGTTPVTKESGVAETAAALKAALVRLGLIGA